MDCWIQPCQQFLITLARSTACLRLLLEDIQDAVGGITAIELRSERMGVEVMSREPLVLVMGSLEYCGKVGGRGG